MLMVKMVLDEAVSEVMVLVMVVLAVVLFVVVHEQAAVTVLVEV